jgi:hypothetical protein
MSAIIERYAWVAPAVIFGAIIILVARLLFPPPSPELCFVDRGPDIRIETVGPSGYLDQALVQDASCPSGMRWINGKK